MSSFTQRMLGAARLDVPTIEEVESDRSATGQALGVVVLSSFAAGIGGLFYFGLGTILSGVLGAVIGWALWAALIWLIGTKMLAEPQTRSDWAEIARTTGFAQSPGLLRVFGFIPVIGWVVMAVANIWMLIAMIVAVRQALDYRDTWRAIVVVLIGWVLNLILFAAITRMA
ncbi:YIP1 family protein [Hydrocarboniphaga sp.]|uniref:YIP1 family protein n=1 Tax=Hydrocarboniphaga sp. TaxID=2033016 RepID=UPI003D11A5CD